MHVIYLLRCQKWVGELWAFGVVVLSLRTSRMSLILLKAFLTVGREKLKSCPSCVFYWKLLCKGSVAKIAVFSQLSGLLTAQAAQVPTCLWRMIQPLRSLEHNMVVHAGPGTGVWWIWAKVPLFPGSNFAISGLDYATDSLEQFCGFFLIQLMV